MAIAIYVVDVELTESCLFNFSSFNVHYCHCQPKLCPRRLNGELNPVRLIGLKVAAVAENHHFAALEPISVGLVGRLVTC